MTRDEYFQLKQKYANAGFENMTDAEMNEFARYSNTFSKLLDTVPLFGGCLLYTSYKYRHPA